MFGERVEPVASLFLGPPAFQAYTVALTPDTCGGKEDKTVLARPPASERGVEQRLPFGASHGNTGGLGFDETDLVGVGMGASIPVDAKAWAPGNAGP